MKILRILFISLVILIAIVMLAAVIFVKTFDINRFKPQIISQASKALNRQVDFARPDLGISLFQGISLKLNNLVIVEDPAFGKGEFLAAKDVSLGFDILGYFFRKQVNIPSIFVDSCRITIIRQKDGTINVQSLAKSNPAPTSFILPAIFISSLKGQNCTIMFIDHSFDPALSLEISDLSFSVSRISLNEPFPFSVEAAILSRQKNIKFQGKAQIDLKTKKVTVSELKGRIDLSWITLEKIPFSLPMVKSAILPISLNGKLDVALQELIVGPKGLSSLTADASLTNGSLQFKEMGSPIKNIDMNAKITQNEILADKISAHIGQGLINGSFSVEDYLSQQGYNFSADAQNLNLQDLIAPDRLPVKAEGIVFASIKLKGRGFNAEALHSNLSGQTNVSLTKIKLKNINVLRTVLDKISVIPGLVEKFEATLPERFKQKLTQKDTVLSDIKLPILIENSQLIIKDTVLEADEFLFKGKGQAGFDGAFSLEGSFLIPQDLSASMIAKVSQLQYLLNDKQQIYIPLKILGQAGQLNFNVDVEYIAKKLLMDQVKKQIFKALDKVLGKEEP